MQQCLVTTILNLKLATAMLGQTSHSAAEIVKDALESGEHADAGLQELAGGIMPAALGDGGLRAAVRSLLRYIALPVSVQVMPDRLPAHVETTAYLAQAFAQIIRTGAPPAALHLNGTAVQNGRYRVELQTQCVPVRIRTRRHRRRESAATQRPTSASEPWRSTITPIKAS